MSVHIIIDGYNLIRQSSQWSMLDLQDMQLGRDTLLKDLAAYKKQRAHRITVVFDAADVSGLMDRSNTVRGISVRYSAPGESADTLIKRMAGELREKALVVSSDRDITDYAAGCGAAVIESPEFEMKMSMAAFGDPGGIGEDETSGWIPTTRKKGPDRRLSKRRRRNQSKINKL